MRRSLVAAAIPLAVLLACGLTTARAATASQRVPVDRQLYVSTAPQDACTGTADICMGVAGGEETARGFAHVDLAHLPDGSTLTGLRLTLVPDAANTGGNLEVSAAALQACVLTTGLPAQVSSSGYPGDDCAHASAIGSAGADGSWTFDLTRLAAAWATGGNTGLDIVPVRQSQALPAPPTAPPPLLPSPPSEVGTPDQAWSLAFDTSKTSAVADLTTAAPSTSAAPAAVPVVLPPAGSPPPPPAAALPLAGLAPVAAAPVAVPAVAAPPPVASPAPAAADTPAPFVVTPPPVTVVVIRHGWFLVAIALAGLALGVLAGTVLRELRSHPGARDLASFVVAARRGRSQVAATVGLLLVAAVIAAGAAGHATTVTTQAAAPSGALAPGTTP